MSDSKLDWRREIFSRTMLTCIFTGFSSGLPLYLLINLVLTGCVPKAWI
ncbi:hypothetical protein [Paludibacterium denitrificans]